MKRPKIRIPRRRALAGLGASMGALALGDLVLSPPARAGDVDPDEQPLLVVFEFRGGFDTLLSLDPRDHTDPKFDGSGGVETGYHTLTKAGATLFQGTDPSQGSPTGLITPSGSNIDFGLAMTPIATAKDENDKGLFEDFCVIRGINMATLSHGVGSQYFNTGKFPRALSASGSSLGTWWARENPTAFKIPNLAIATSSYNEGLDPRATGLYIGDYTLLQKIFYPIDDSQQPHGALAHALTKFQHQTHCLDHQFDAGGRVSLHRAAYDSSRTLLSPEIAAQFDFTTAPTVESVKAIYDHFGIIVEDRENLLKGPLGRAAIAAQAITQSVSQTVTVRLTDLLDTHFDGWKDLQPTLQASCWDAVAKFITYAKSKKDSKGKPYWDRMTVVCVSEFSRTPRLNTRGGRDHWLYSSALVAGNGIRGNQVIGQSSDEDYSGLPIDMKTGAIIDQGPLIRPPDVWATVLHAAGLSYENVSNQSPVLIEPMLDS